MHRNRYGLLAATVALCLAVTGCAQPRVSFSQSETNYDRASASALLQSTSTTEIADEPTARAKQLRLNALTDLRSEGAAGRAAAQVITKVVPNDDKTVPVYIERARFEGKDALLVIEAYGRPAEKLDSARLWVMSPDGRILFSSMR